jgi:hypothetical protein
MNVLINNILDYFNNKSLIKKQAQEQICALRLSYNNFDEKVDKNKNKNDYYCECVK